MESGFIHFGAWEVDEIHAIAGTFPDEAPLLRGFHQAHKLSKLKIRVDILGWLWYDKISLDRLIGKLHTQHWDAQKPCAEIMIK